MTTRPKLGKDCYIAPTAYVAGDLVLGDQCTVMHQVAIRADVAPIRLGNRVNVQDGSILHTQYEVPLEIADNVAIGHRVVVHCRRVGAWSLIGTGSIVLDGAIIGEHCLVAAGAVVLPGTVVKSGSLVAGVPAKVRRQLTEADHREISRIVDAYVRLGQRHQAGEFPNIAPAPIE